MITIKQKHEMIFNIILILQPTCILFLKKLIYDQHYKIISNYTFSTLSNKMEPTITWNDNGLGIEKIGDSSKTITSIEIGIKRAIHNYCVLLLNNPTTLQEIYNGKKIILTKRPDFLDLINCIRPRINYNKLYVHIGIMCTVFMKNYFEIIISSNINIHTNFTLVGLTGLKRNWKECCAICLEDNHMGKTCNCGHTEITMFQPCGHTICTKSCFVDFREKLKLPALKCKEYFFGDQKFYAPDTLDVNTKDEFICPICKCKVIETFDPNNINMSNSLDLDQMIDMIKKAYYDEMEQNNVINNEI